MTSVHSHTDLHNAAKVPGARDQEFDRAVVTHIFKAACDVDLGDVRDRVAREHADWSDERVATAVLEYRKWLTLCAMRPAIDDFKAGAGASLGMTSKDVDQVWHAHILFTMQYACDCMRVAGRFIHHAPTTEKERAAKQHDNSSSKRTHQLLRAVFGAVDPVWGAPNDDDECDECASKSCQVHECTAGDCRHPNCSNECNGQ